MAKKAGKYAEVLEELPKSFGEEPARQVKINAIKAEIARDAKEKEIELTGAELTRRYGEARAEKLRIALLEKANSLVLSSYEQLLAERFERDETSRVVLNDGGAVTIYYEPHAKLVDGAANRKWCMENGYENDLQLMWSKLNSITKERLLAGEDEPTGVVAVALLKVRYNKPNADGSAAAEDVDTDDSPF